MAQILDPIPNGQRDRLLCCYVNATSQIQIARITNISKWYFERVVFPGQRLVFETFPEALLEIHTGMMASAILSDTIPCERLCLHDSRESQQAAPLESASQATETSPLFKQNEPSNQDKEKSSKPTLVSAK